MLIGEYMQTVDAKGRVNIPAKFRADLGQTFVVAKGVRCIAVYPAAEWDKFLEKTTHENTKLMRFFAAGSSECELDTQGRVVIPPSLRKYIDLQKEIVVVGTYTYIEIWNRSEWENYFDDEEFSAENLEDTMQKYGLQP